MSVASDEELTYVIPTYNRPEFLYRLLSYYAKVGCSAPILIADSSEPAIKLLNQKSVSEFQSLLNVQFRHFDLGVIPKCRQILEHVKTPFTVFSADDDFLVPSAAQKCCRFLSENSEYGTCGGTALFGHAGLGEFVPARTYRSLHSSSAVQRLKNVSLGQYYCLFYAVHCTKRLQERFRITDEFTNYESSRILPEVLLLQLMALDGKIKLIDDVTYIRQGHGDNDSCRLPNVQTPEVFQADFDRYCTPLLNRLCEYGVTNHSANQLVKQSLIDLVPGCRPLLNGREPRLRQVIAKLGKRVRKTVSFGPTGAGSKFRMDVATVGSKDFSVAEALRILAAEGTSVTARSPRAA